MEHGKVAPFKARKPEEDATRRAPLCWAVDGDLAIPTNSPP